MTSIVYVYMCICALGVVTLTFNIPCGQNSYSDPCALMQMPTMKIGMLKRKTAMPTAIPTIAPALRVLVVLQLGGSPEVE